MVNFEGFFSQVIKDVENGLDTLETKEVFGEPVIGEVDFSRLSYPTIHVVPGDSIFEGDQEYSDSINIFYYFKKGLRTSRYISILEKVEKTIENVLDKLETNEDIYAWRVESIENFAGETAGNQLNVINVELEIEKLKNLSK